MKGGYRPGAGRPKGGRYGEQAKQIRVLTSSIADVFAFLDSKTLYNVPLYLSTVQAGFPSPADDYLETPIDLNDYLIPHQASTFMVRASGNSMMGAGIQSGDLLIVDRSLAPVHGKIVIAAMNGELTVKRLSMQEGRMQLLPAHPDYPAMTITEELETVIWGIVTYVIHQAY